MNEIRINNRSSSQSTPTGRALAVRFCWTEQMCVSVLHFFVKVKFKPRRPLTPCSFSHSEITALLKAHLPHTGFFLSCSTVKATNTHTHTHTHTYTHAHAVITLLFFSNTVAGSCPDIRRASEKKKRASKRSGLGGGIGRCWWRRR